MIFGLLALMSAAFIWGPSMVQQANSGCYIVDKDMAQHRPCRAEETR